MGMTFKRIRVQGYRSLQDVDVELRGLNVLIGPNGSGKTSFLDIFALLARGARRELSRALSDRGGLQDILTSAGHGQGAASQLKVTLWAPLPQTPEPLVYDLCLRPRGVGHVIEQELLTPFYRPGITLPLKWIDARPGQVLFFDPEKEMVAPTWQYQEEELALAQVPNIFVDAERFRATLAACRVQGLLDLGPTSPLRNPQSLAPTLFPGLAGEDLFAVLYNLQSQHEDTYERILEAIRAGFEDFDEFKFPAVAAGKIALVWKDRQGRRFYSHQLSEGTLRFLWLTTLLLSPALPPILLIDEPELSLHPEMLKVLAGLLQEAAEQSQIFVATHSDRLVRWLQPEDLVIFNKREGVTSIQRGDDPSIDIQRWLGEYTLDQVWLMGEMGGRP